MKKLISIGVLCLIFLTALYPVRYDAQIYNHSLPLNAYCPAFTKAFPIETLVKFLSKKDSHPEWQACALETLINKTRNLPRTDDPKVLALAAMAKLKNRPKTSPILIALAMIRSYIEHFKPMDRYDLIAYFYARMLEEGYGSSKYLAMLYYDGQGVPQDKETAKHLFRLSASTSFRALLKGEACAEKFDPRLKYSKNDLQTEQIKWFQNLCYKKPEELEKIASWYSQDDNPYRDVRIATSILYNLKKAHNYETGKNYKH